MAEDEIERIAGELSGILEHVDRIAALDLEQVEPTSHVVALENVLRSDLPEASLTSRARARVRARALRWCFSGAVTGPGVSAGG